MAYKVMVDGSSFLVRGVAITAALLVLCVLLFQNQPTTVISTWSAPQSLPVSNTSSIGITGAAQPQAASVVERPQRAPLQGTLVLSQGYGVGTHAPAAVWGGVDLVIDANGDGVGDPTDTLGAPVYATNSGIATVKADTWPAGNYVAIENAQYKTAYAHLASFAVTDGQQVQAGQLIGYIGVTGQSTGPHLHYEVWVDGSNVNPLEYQALGTNS